ncbi:glycosyltransferase [Candidatus Pacearchaeota archaeon]|nr:glycosyltransferase [Candidatus Pacearchaeota archaeon]
MKIAYVNIIWALSYGITQRFRQQAEALKRIKSVETQCILVIPKEYLKFVRSDPNITVIPIALPLPFMPAKWLPSLLIWRRLAKILSAYNAVVTRWTVPSPYFLDSVRKIPIFTEHHSKEIDEMKLRGGIQNKLLIILERQYGPKILGAVRGIIGRTDEIRRYELERAKSQCPSLVLSNGFGVEDVCLTSTPLYTGRELNIAFVSSHLKPWHGLDRFLKGLCLWKGGSPKVALHLIGRLPKGQKSVIKSMGLSNSVYVHDVLYGPPLDKILSNCHLAIGSLGLHRLGLKQACVLKVREYTARGIPFVIAYNDPDLPDDLPWVFHISPDDSPVSIEDIIAFARSVNRIPSIGREMRAYAERHLSWRIKMERMISFVQDHV